MNIQNFVKKENIDTLWEVISDEQIFTFLSKENQQNVFNLFVSNIKGFFETEQKNVKNNLIIMNKKYIILILNYIKTNYPSPNKIKIAPIVQNDNNNNNNIAITYEEIQQDKQKQFDIQMIKHQEDFKSFNNIKIPPVPDFSDKLVESEKPIKEMDKILQDIINKRKYEDSRIMQTLPPQQSQQSKINPESLLQLELKTHIETETATETATESLHKKNVSWGDNKEFIFSNTEERLNRIETKLEILLNLFKELKELKEPMEENKKID